MEEMNLITMKNENTRAYVLINTTEYTDGREYSVNCVEVKESELSGLKEIMGWDMKEEYCRYDDCGRTNRIDELEVGESLDGEYGSYIMRVK